MRSGRVVLPECPHCGEPVYYATDGTPLEDDPDHEPTPSAPGRPRVHDCQPTDEEGTE